MKEYRFKARIEAGMGGGAGVAFPFDTEKEFGTRGKIPVKATLDGVAYAGSLIACGGPWGLRRPRCSSGSATG